MKRVQPPLSLLIVHVKRFPLLEVYLCPDSESAIYFPRNHLQTPRIFEVIEAREWPLLPSPSRVAVEMPFVAARTFRPPLCHSQPPHVLEVLQTKTIEQIILKPESNPRLEKPNFYESERFKDS